jgi:hypothetical protein
VPRPKSTESVSPDVVSVLDALDPSPACVYNGKYDLLACNEAYAALFPFAADATGIARNALYQIYVAPDGIRPVTDEDVCTTMVAMLRSNYALHVGEPDWVEFIETLCHANEEFAQLWAEHPILDQPPVSSKAFDCHGVGTVRVRATGFPLQRTQESRMVVYIPETAADAALIAELRRRNRERRLQPA